MTTRPEMTQRQFVVAIAVAIGKATGAKALYALPLAARAFREFAADERIEFGDPRYAWDEAAAMKLAQEMVIDP